MRTSGTARILDNAEFRAYLLVAVELPPSARRQEQNLPMIGLLSLFQQRGYPLYSTGIIGPISVVSIRIPVLQRHTAGDNLHWRGSRRFHSPASGRGGGDRRADGRRHAPDGERARSARSRFRPSPPQYRRERSTGSGFIARSIPATGNMTVTICGQTAATACTGTNASPLAQAFTVTNSAGTTALTVAITCTSGTCNLGGYEEIATHGEQRHCH